MTKRNLGLIGGTFAAFAIAFGAAGCASRTHLTPTYGRAYTETFERQAVPPDTRPKKKNGADPIEGLDSHEASAIARNYRRSLSGREGGDTGTGQMLIMSPGAAPQGGYMPPPSVPDQR